MCKAGRHAPRLLAMAFAMDSHCHFSKRCHIADVKNIPGDDQATLMVDRIPQLLRRPSDFMCVYVYQIMTGALRLLATAVTTDSHRRLSKILHVANVRNIAGDDQDQSKFHNYEIVCYEIKQYL